MRRFDIKCKLNKSKSVLHLWKKTWEGLISFAIYIEITESKIIFVLFESPCVATLFQLSLMSYRVPH